MKKVEITSLGELILDMIKSGDYAIHLDSILDYSIDKEIFKLIFSDIPEPRKSIYLTKFSNHQDFTLKYYSNFIYKSEKLDMFSSISSNSNYADYDNKKLLIATVSGKKTIPFIKYSKLREQFKYQDYVIQS